MPVSTTAATSTVLSGIQRASGDVFSKLERSDINRVGIGSLSQDLQYPVDLGVDEYNQFVLFTIYEKDGTQEIQDQRLEVGKLQVEFKEKLAQKLDDDAQAVADMLKEWFGIEGDNKFIQAIAKGSVTIDALTAQVLNYITGDDAISVSDDGNSDAELAFKALQKAKKELAEKIDNKRDEDERISEQQFKLDRSQSTIDKFQKLGIKDRRDRNNQGRTRLSSATDKIGTNIALYIPNKIVNNGSITYNGVDFSAINQISGLAGGDISGFGPSLKRYFAGVFDQAGSIVGLNLNAAEAIQAISGVVINPRQEQLFQGVETRSFDFTFSLAPRSEDEAVTINKIVRAFRMFSHPSVGETGFFLRVPAEFEIRYYKIFPDDSGGEVVAENLFLNKIGRCALTSVNVDYTPNGVNSTFHDGSPTRTTLTMTFSELRPLVREDIEEGY